MILTFIAPSTRHPVGGNAMIYEFASAMAERGHTVHLYHIELFGGDAVTSLDEIGWYDFRVPLNHHFVPTSPLAPHQVEAADIYFGYAADVETHPHLGLPVCWVQGYRMYSEADELRNFHNPCPKLCIAGWLVRVGVELGVPAEQLIHIPNAIHPRFRLTQPIEARPDRVAICWNEHLNKNAPLALQTLERIHLARPDIDLVAFSSKAPSRDIPDWLTFFVDPPQEVLVDDIYNGSSIFLWTSIVEGFGFPAVEAMACGATLITTDNGGSEDYAFDGDTARVATEPDADELARLVLELVDDPSERVRLATRGQAHGSTFTWEASATKLEQFLVQYLDDPTAYGRPD